MDTSIDEDTSISPSGPSRYRSAGLGLGLNVHGAQISPESSYEYPNPVGGHDESSLFQSGHGQQSSGAVGANAQSGAEGGAEVEGDGEGHSETSSAMFDPDADPEGFARRQDELAGVLEMGEKEAKAIRWGPAIGRERDAPILPIADFKALVKHHLDTTEWRYATNQEPGEESLGLGGFMDPLDVGHWKMENHPIRVLGTSWPEGQTWAGEEMEGSASGSTEGL